MDYCSLHHHDVWQYDEKPPLSTEKPVDELADFLYNSGGCVNAERHLESTESGELRLTHGWLKCSCWKAYDMARQTNGVTVTEFSVTKQPTDGTPPIQATIKQDSTPTEPTPSIEELLNTVKTAYPFNPSEVSAANLEYKCGDVSALLKQAIWVEHRVDLPIVSGAIADPQGNDGWPHAFLRITPTDVSNLETTLFVDGTAKQFCDKTNFPQTLGAEDELDAIQTITPNHTLYKYYFENRELVDTDFHSN